MKMASIFAAATLAIAGLGVTATSAQAQGPRHDMRYDHGRDHHDGYDRSDRHDRSDRYDRYRRHDNGNHYGWRNGRGHQRCTTQWRHHRRVRVCR